MVLRTVVLALCVGVLPAPGRAASSIAITPAMEVAWGERALGLFLEERTRTHDAVLAGRVSRIGMKIADVSDRPTLPYRFIVVEGEELQAYSFPGGTICLSEGLARFFHSDAEIGFVIGHEIAHTALRHQVSQLEFLRALEEGRAGENALLNVVKGFLQREHEMEADLFGALYALRAGYRYDACRESLERLEHANRKLTKADTHPHYVARIDALDRFRLELERSVEAFDAGVEALDRHDSGEAIPLFKYFVATFPNSVTGRVNLGLSHVARMRATAGTPNGLAEVLRPLRDAGVSGLRDGFEANDMYQAHTHFERAIAIQPDAAIAHAGMGLIYMRLGRIDAARHELEKADAGAPRQWDVLLCLGNVEFLAGSYEAAISYYSSALESQPGSAEIRKNLARSYEKVGMNAEARRIWLELEHHPELGGEARNHLQRLSMAG